MRCLLAAWFVALAMNAAAASTAPPACTSAEHRQFDFWIGRWQVFGPGGKKLGDNVIEAIDGGCALIERWRGQGGFTGTSLNSWDAASQRWRQHWVDSQGGLLQLSGRLDGARMVLTGEQPHADKPGIVVRERISWTPLPGGAVRQHWERTEDGGASWSTVFDGRYEKAPTP